MNNIQATELGTKIIELQSLMIAFVTDGRTLDQPAAYRDLYADVTIELEHAKYPNTNPHKSLEVFWAFCKLQGMTTYAERRRYVEEIYADILLDLKRIQKNTPTSRNWTKANDALTDELTPIRAQWLKAKNFIVAASPDYENSVKESINSIESCLMVLLKEPSGTLGKIIKRADLDPDIERLISQCYGLVSNRSFVRHGGTEHSSLTKHEAIFFLEFAATCIVYIASRLREDGGEI